VPARVPNLQECVYNKACIDKKSPSVLARLARQAALMYEEVKHGLGQGALASHFDKSWVSHTSMKASLYDVEALVQLGKQHRVDEKIGPEIAVLQEAFKKVQVGGWRRGGWGGLAQAAVPG
jgi:programmed cell death 6-interacting protein